LSRKNKENKKKTKKKNLEVLEEEDRGGVRLEREIELEATIQQAYSAIIAADHHFPSAARTALDLPCRHILGNGALSSVFLLEELEFSPLIHDFFQ
jgi:hypothetical protein